MPLLIHHCMPPLKPFLKVSTLLYTLFFLYAADSRVIPFISFNNSSALSIKVSIAIIGVFIAWQTLHPI